MPATMTKNDWKLFQERIGLWQERAMENLLKRYAMSITNDKVPASKRFWELEKSIEKDKLYVGVQCQLSKHEAPNQIYELIKSGDIGKKDLDGFSESLLNTLLKKLAINDRFLNITDDENITTHEPLDEVFKNGIFKFDITKLLKDIENGTIVPVKKLVKVSSVNPYTDDAGLNPEFVEKADLSRPLVLLEMTPDAANYNKDLGYDDYSRRGFVLADGYHRVAKAKYYQITGLYAYIIPMETHINYLCGHKKEYAEYWNSKLKDKIWDSL